MSFTRYSTKELRRKFRKDLPFGLEKLRVIREDRTAFCEKKLKELDHTFSPDTLRATFGGHEKEKDWAISGGLASGIGGAGAGIASALNTQIENAEIRRRNAQRDANAEKIVRLAKNASGILEGEYLSALELMYTTKPKEADLRIGISKSTKELASYLQIDILNGHTIRVLSSYDEARIDGYLKIVVENEDDFILPMPYYGIEKTESNEVRYINPVTILIEARRDGNAVENKLLSVEPLVLWTIEKEANDNNYSAHALSDVEKSPDYQRFMSEWNLLPVGTAMPEITARQVGTFCIAFFCSFVMITLIGAMVMIISSDGNLSAEETFGKPQMISALISLILSYMIAKNE